MANNYGEGLYGTARYGVLLNTEKAIFHAIHDPLIGKTIIDEPQEKIILSNPQAKTK